MVHRADGSGTTYTWVDFLSKVDREFKKKVGVATSVTWPVGLGGKGNEGVAGMVRQTPGSIGYVELIYALQNKIAYAPVKNAAGDYVNASLDLGRRRRRHRQDPRRLPGLHHQCSRQGGLSHLHLHLDPGFPGPARRRQEEGPARFPDLGRDQGPGLLQGPGLCPPARRTW